MCSSSATLSAEDGTRHNPHEITRIIRFPVPAIASCSTSRDGMGSGRTAGSREGAEVGSGQGTGSGSNEAGGDFERPVSPCTMDPPVSHQKDQDQEQEEQETEIDSNHLLSQATVTLTTPLQSLLGYPPLPSDPPSLEWWDSIIHPEDLPRVKTSLHQHLQRDPHFATRQARLWSCSYRVKTCSGEWLLLGERCRTVRSDGYVSCIESVLFSMEKREAERNRIKGTLGGKTGTTVVEQNDFQIVCGNMYSAIFMMNSSGYVTFMNAAAERLTGFKYEDISKLTFHEAVHSLRPDGSGYSIHDCPIYMAQVNNQKLTNASEVFVDTDGKFFPVVYSVAPLHGGYDHGAVIEFRDVSEEISLQEDRMQALRMNEQKSAKIKQEEFLRRNMAVFTDFLCHEVRNPLHGMAANKNFLQESLQQLEELLQPVLDRGVSAQSGTSTAEGEAGRGTGESIKDGAHALFSSMRGYLQAIDDCATHQGMILNSVLDLSRLEMGALKLGSELFCPYEIAMQAVKMSRAQGDGRSVKIELEADDATKKTIVRGDPTPVRQVFLNLIGNGVKFSNAGGTVTARMRLRQFDHTNKLRMEGSIQDEGVGMTPVEVGRLFQRFAQANRRVSEVYGGSGLGLSISKELLKLMEGEMDVISEKGKGSQFAFTAKFDKVSPTELKEYKQKERSSRPNGQGSPSDTQRKAATQRRFTHLLAAEDNGLNRKILAKYLHKCDKLMLVNDGQQAYDYYQKHAHEIDLIIMDQEMPQVDGKEATKMIRAFEKRFEAEQKRKDDSDGAFAEGPGQRRKHKDWKYRVPIIALSGNVRSEQIAEAKNAGMDDYLAKPCAKQSLEDMLLKWENIVLGPLDEHSSSRNEEPTSQVEQTTQQQVKKETDNEVLRLPPREEP